MCKEQLFIFVHVPRTAGTTFVRQIEANYKKHELLRLYRDELDLKSDKSYTYEDYLKLVKKKLNALSKSDKNKIKVIYGHRVPYGIHKFFNKKPYYITFIRPPIKRSKSLYNLWRHSFEHTKNEDKQSDKFKYGFLVEGEVVNFLEWLENKLELRKSDNTGITYKRFFMELGYLDGYAQTDTEKFIKKFDHIGDTKNYMGNYIYLSKLMGLKRYMPSENVSRNTYINKLDKSQSEIITRLLKYERRFYKQITTKGVKNVEISMIDKIRFIYKVFIYTFPNIKLFLREIAVYLSLI